MCPRLKLYKIGAGIYINSDNNYLQRWILHIHIYIIGAEAWINIVYSLSTFFIAKIKLFDTIFLLSIDLRI